MTTVPNDTCVLGAGKTATLQEDNKLQSFALKVQHNDDIRRFALSDLSWEPLIKKVAELFKLREDTIVLKYKDEEGDLVTITSAEELLEAHRLAIQNSTLLRLFAFSDAPRHARRTLERRAGKPENPPAVQDPLVAADPADIKAQKKLLKEQKKQQKMLYKESKKELKREQKKLYKDTKKELRKHPRPDDAASFDPTKGSWREQRQAWRQQRRQMMCGDSNPIAAVEGAVPSPDRCGKRWKDLSPEERMERRTARREARMREHGCRCPGGGKRLVARFVKHVTIPDGAELTPGQRFVKTWRLRNEGEEAWPAESKLIFISRKNGDQMGAPDSVPVPGVVQPTHELDISVDLVAPEAAGRYVGFWRLCTPEGRKFGQRIWVKIDVVCSSTSEDEGRAPVATESSTTYDKLEQEVEQSFFEITKDEEGEKEAEVPKPAAASKEQKPTIAALLKQLKDLGFSEDIGRNIALLKKHDGNIDKVIAELLA